MAQDRSRSLSLVHTGLLIAVVLLPDFLGAVPVEQLKEDVSVSSDAVSGDQKLVRNRRNLAFMALPQFQRVPDFWAWYKLFTETHNQEGVEDLDRLYLTWLQNKHRSEEGPAFNHYLNHLSEIYKSCADSDDPECIAEHTSKPKAAMVMPAQFRAPAVHVCNPYTDPYCMFPMLAKGAPVEPAPAPAPVKLPVPIFSPMLPSPMKTPTGYYYYAPVLEPFLSHEQRVELMRICKPEDVECLQYHLRAAYGYRPVAGPAPSYSALNCNPKDPYCKPVLVQKAPTGFYHMLYPSCDPAVDPLCVAEAGPAPLSADGAPKEQHCNPLFDGGCNPLTATKLSGLTKPVLEYLQKDAPAAAAAASVPAPLTCDPRTNPFCILAAAHYLRRPQPQLPEHQVRYRLGVHGKTRDGHDCYVHYDKDCIAVGDQPKALTAAKAPATPYCHPFDPSCAKFASPAADVAAPAQAAGPDGIILPHPDCDPEIDYNCRLRRAKPAAAAAAAITAAADEPATADEPARMTRSQAAPSFEDFLSGYLSQYQQK